MSLGITVATETRAALLQGYPVVATLEHTDAGAALGTGDMSGLATVGAGVEFTNLGAGIPSPPFHSVHIDIDISDTRIVITALTDQPPNDRDIIRLDFDPQHTMPPLNLPQLPAIGVFVNPATTWAGFVQGLGSINMQTINVNMTMLTASAGQQIVLDIIPEPTGGALAAAAGAGLAAVGRRRKT